MCVLASSFIVDEDVEFIMEKGPKDHARIANKDSGGSRVLVSLQQKLDWIKVAIQNRKDSSAVKSPSAQACWPGFNLWNPHKSQM